MPEITTLKLFIEREMTERGMSAREFAKFVGVASSTISRITANKGASEPSITFLSKLADATKVDICTLVYLVAPGGRREPTPTARDLANRISKLPKDRQNLIDAVLMGITLQNSNQMIEQDE